MSFDLSCNKRFPTRATYALKVIHDVQPRHGRIRVTVEFRGQAGRLIQHTKRDVHLIRQIVEARGQG